MDTELEGSVQEPEAVKRPPQTTSDLLKINRALGGDDMWGLRLEIAFKIKEVPDTEAHRISVTRSCVADIDCDIEGTVSTERVTDAQVLDAIASLIGGEPDAEE